MSGSRRVAILAAVLGAVGATVACETLVGITDREAAPMEGGADAPVGTSSGGSGSSSGASSGSGSSSGATDTGADATQIADATTDGDAGVVVDSGGSNDAGAGHDAQPGVDASDAGDGGGGVVTDPDVPCTQQPNNPRFCDDFDLSTTPGQKWDTAYTLADGGVLQFDTTHFVSSPQSAQIVAAPVSGTTAGIQLIKTVTGFTAGVRFAFDFRIDSPSYLNFPQTCVGQMYIRQSSAAQSQINLVVGPSTSSYLQASVPDAGAVMVTASAPPLGTWVRAVVSYQSDGTLSLIENGQLVGSVTIPSGPAATVLVISGTPFIVASGTETVTLEDDNVVVTAQP